MYFHLIIKPISRLMFQSDNNPSRIEAENEVKLRFEKMQQLFCYISYVLNFVLRSMCLFRNRLYI